MVFVLFTPIQAFPARAQEITVSAAIAFKESFVELGNAFETGQKGVRVRFNFGASGDLARQSAAGAPVEVFASTGLREMDELDQKGATIPDSRVNFAGNRMVLAIPGIESAPGCFFRPHPEGGPKNRHRESPHRPGRPLCRRAVTQIKPLGTIER
ncbi:MAG: hypothetical protein EHM75_07965 [Desulfobacteraceae bacterium]|nr:MAG: hypothetical protein EHM75_07965 [Desulfobacteraceae bacterium]